MKELLKEGWNSNKPEKREKRSNKLEEKEKRKNGNQRRENTEWKQESRNRQKAV